MTGITPKGSVVLITGASSGIGRATALALAERGANVVLAARSGADLDQVGQDCEAHGTAALAVPTDVSQPDAVAELARRAIERFGHFDAWVNCAAVMAYGNFWDIPAESYRQVLDTNLFGTIHGARAALDHFRERESGVLINTSSVYGRVTTPFVSPYVVSKYAIRGLTQCLKQETSKLPGVDVCAPQAVDTPIFRHVANYTEREMTALPLTVDPDRVVRAILRRLERPRSEIIVGAFGHILTWGRALAPFVYDRLAPIAMDRLAFRASHSPPSDGNVFTPQPRLNAVDGGWRRERRTIRRGVAVAVAALIGGRALGRLVDSATVRLHAGSPPTGADRGTGMQGRPRALGMDHADEMSPEEMTRHHHIQTLWIPAC